MTENTKSNWIVDMNHSALQFKVKHLGLSNVSGTFKSYKGNVQTENDDFIDAEVSLEMDADSIDTKLDERDNFLKSPHFFDTQKYPKIIFSGKLKKGADSYELEGELTIREAKRNVNLAVEYNGIVKGRFGELRAGFEVTGKINRKDFGLTWNLLTEAGGIIAGEEIKLHFDIEIIKQTQ